jgi:hypothetical protein
MDYLEFLKSKIWFIRPWLPWLSIAWVLFLVGDRHLQYQHWERSDRVICNDVISYYAYLPAIFIEKDVSLSFVNRNSNNFSDLYWPEESPTKKNLIKTTSGLSFLYAPFFIPAYAIASLKEEDTVRGNEPIFKIALILSSFVWLGIGLFFLKGILEKYFDPVLTAGLLFSCCLATNLWYYSIEEMTMPHGYNFALINLYVFLVVTNKFESKNYLLHGLILGLICLIRPTNILVGIVFLMYGVNSIREIKQRISRILIPKHVMMGIVGIIIVWLPQMLYWLKITDKLMFFSYTGERFFWLEPELIKGLFGFRKGLFIYTPLLILVIPGYYYMLKIKHELAMGAVGLFIFLCYITFSWWAWWYGGGFGMRPFVDFIGLFMLPIGVLFTYLIENKRRVITLLLGCFVVATILLNRFQTQQYRHQIIHYDGMNWEAYKHAWLRTEYSPDLLDIIERPDYEEAKERRD